MPRYKGDSYEDTDYEPDTDGPDTTASDQMLDDAIKGQGDGIGKISALHSGAKGYKDYQDYRAQAAKQMIRKPATEE